MVGDYVTVREVDNGFTIEMNPYGNPKRRSSKIAKDRTELLEVIDGLFPEDQGDEFPVQNRRACD